MNKIKIFTCLILSMFLVGCSATYNVNIDGNTVSEKFEFSESDSSKWNEIVIAHTEITYKNSVYENYEWPTGAFYQKNGNPYEPIRMEGVEYYNQELIDDGNKIGIKYNYDFTLDNYKDSNAAKSCFKTFIVTNSNEKLNIIAKDASYCFNTNKMLDKVTVKLTTTYKVIYSNADSNKNNTYIWNIKSTDSNNSSIKIELSKDENYNDKVEEDDFKNSSTFIILIGFGIVFGIGLIVFLVVYIKNKSVNKI